MKPLGIFFYSLMLYLYQQQPKIDLKFTIFEWVGDLSGLRKSDGFAERMRKKSEEVKSKKDLN